MLWRAKFLERKGSVTFAAENRIAAAAWLAEAEMAWGVLFGDLEELGHSKFKHRSR